MTAIPNALPTCAADGAPVFHFALAAAADIETQQLVAHFQQLDAYGRRMVLAMAAAAVRLKAPAAEAAAS